MRYLVDTDWLIDVLSGLNAAAATLQQLSGDGVGLSIVTLGEIYEGAALDPDPVAAKERYKAFVAPFPVLPLTVPIMERFAELRAQLRRSGALIPDFDLLIAATALEEDLVLVTRNRRHFTRIPGLQLVNTSPPR
jgi:predicted nucleic acid-binding protein